jgi:hypothetical protein
MLARRIQRIMRGASAPNLVVAQRVIDRMVAAAQQHLEDETGEAMVGLVVPGPLPNSVPTLYVLDTISPDASAVRQFHTFQQGDARQDELIWWLQENWRRQREQMAGGGKLARLLSSGQKWDVPLRYLGDWHKQPGYMIHPSGGDLMTALDWILEPENNSDFLLAPIVTLDHPTTIDMEGATTNFVLVPQGEDSGLRIDFWYIDHRARMFIPIIPAVYPDDQLPELVAYPWHIVNEALLDEEERRLRADGLALTSTATLWDADGKLPLEICWIVARMHAKKLLLLATPHNYPDGAPTIRVAPFTQMSASDNVYDLFERLWPKSEPVDLAYDRAQHHTLLDFVLAAEAALGIERVAPEAEEKPAPITAQESGQAGSVPETTTTDAEAGGDP